MRPDGRVGRVAVLIPVYRDDGRLTATLDALSAQGVPLTAVVVDDGSPEPVVLDRERYGFPIILVRLAENGGIERALNAGLERIIAADFEFVARLDNGDLCAPERLGLQLAFLDANPDVHLVGSNVEWRSDSGALAFRMSLPLSHEAITRAMHHTVCLIHPTVTFRTSVVRAVGSYSTCYPAAEDFEFFWRVARRFRVANLPGILLVTRFDPHGISMQRRTRQLLSKLRIQLRFFRTSDPRSYYGVAKTLALFGAPYSMIVRAKRVLSTPKAA